MTYKVITIHIPKRSYITAELSKSQPDWPIVRLAPFLNPKQFNVDDFPPNVINQLKYYNDTNVALFIMARYGRVWRRYENKVIRLLREKHGISDNPKSTELYRRYMANLIWYFSNLLPRREDTCSGVLSVMLADE